MDQRETGFLFAPFFAKRARKRVFDDSKTCRFRGVVTSLLLLEDHFGHSTTTLTATFFEYDAMGTGIFSRKSATAKLISNRDLVSVT